MAILMNEAVVSAINDIAVAVWFLIKAYGVTSDIYYVHVYTKWYNIFMATGGRFFWSWWSHLQLYYKKAFAMDIHQQTID